MKSFHPVSQAVFFTAMIMPLMLVRNPIPALISLVGAITILFMVSDGRKAARELTGCLVIFLVLSLMNPLLVHRGSTPLFFLNGRAITKEAVSFGVISSLQLVTAFIWCRIFSVIMTSERIFCLTGKLSPKISAMLTTAVRFVPDMHAQGRKINVYSRISGKYSDSSLINRLKRLMGVFSALVTWSIESAVQTADSMKARGFELGGRTAYSRFRFAAEDAVLVILSVLSGAASVILSDRISINFYPIIDTSSVSAQLLIVAAAALGAALIFPIAFSASITIRRKGRAQ